MKTKRSFFAVLALTMSFAGIAAAQDPPPEYAPPPPPGPPPPAAVDVPATSGFGAGGQIVISDDMQVAILRTSQSFMGASFSATQLQLQPAIDYFVAPNLSIGGQLSIGYVTSDNGGGTSADSTVIGVLPRVGYNIAMAPTASIWPRLALGYVHSSQSSGTGGASISGYNVVLEVFVPVIFHPVPHFFVGGGPLVTTDLAAKLEGQDTAKTTNIGLLSTIGGYFGGT